jgi:hypothetical protein
LQDFDLRLSTGMDQEATQMNKIESSSDFVDFAYDKDQG